MKLILTQEVSGLGAPGDVVEVKDGYGRNYLVPRKLATPWTKGGQSQVDAIRRARASREHSTLDGAVAARDRLQQGPIQLVKRAGTNGRLFGAVTPADIAEAIVAAGGPAVDRRTVVLPRPIKSLGSHTVTIRLHADVTATVEIDVFDPDAPVAAAPTQAEVDAAAGVGTGFVKRATPVEPLPDEDFLAGTASEADDASDDSDSDDEPEFEDTYGDPDEADEAGTAAPATATAG